MQWFVEAAAGTDQGAGDAPGNQILRGSMGGTVLKILWISERMCRGAVRQQGSLQTGSGRQPCYIGCPKSTGSSCSSKCSLTSCPLCIWGKLEPGRGYFCPTLIFLLTLWLQGAWGLFWAMAGCWQRLSTTFTARRAGVPCLARASWCPFINLHCPCSLSFSSLMPMLPRNSPLLSP